MLTCARRFLFISRTTFLTRENDKLISLIRSNELRLSLLPKRFKAYNTALESLSTNSRFISVFEIYSIGIGPSSSHTLGPMKAAKQFVCKLELYAMLHKIHSIYVHLYGSLALTGEGHGTSKAVLLGLMGKDPETIEPKSISEIVNMTKKCSTLNVLNKISLNFDLNQHIQVHKDIFLKKHSNGLSFMAFDINGCLLAKEQCYSVGGGSIVSDGFELNGQIVYNPSAPSNSTNQMDVVVPFPFTTGNQLLQLCESTNRSIAEIIFQNETKTGASKEDIIIKTLKIWRVMESCIVSGLSCGLNSILPGSLKLKRRAPNIFQQQLFNSEVREKCLISLLERAQNILEIIQTHPGSHMLPQGRIVQELDWISLFAIAVNEENADGGRIVTAPTNGAAGVIPAILKYWLEFCQPRSTCSNKTLESDICSYLWTTSAIGALFKHGASISAAEVGCQGEIGVASSMAAGGLAALLGGTPNQVLNASEIAMEHHLGMTCDPMAGLVQIPCIERNALGAIKALTAAQLALKGDGSHYVSLDQVIQTMKQTGLDMKSKYKETSLGGLALHVPKCK